MPAPIDRLRIGGLEVSRLGLGAMRLSHIVGASGSPPRRDDAVRLLRRAVDLGIDFVDTAALYANGENEQLIADAIPPSVIVATKGGLVAEGGVVRCCGRPDALRRQWEASARRLRRDCIDLYYLHRVDPQVPIEDSVGELERLRTEGKVLEIGLSNITLELLGRVIGAKISAVQNAFNVIDRRSESVLDYCSHNGIAFVASSPLGGNPIEPTSALVCQGGFLEEIASAQSVTPPQVALIWIWSCAARTAAIPGTSQLPHLLENADALKRYIEATAHGRARTLAARTEPQMGPHSQDRS